MTFTEFVDFITYPCIFCKTKEQAVDNLHRLITKEQCGYDEGKDFWIAQIEIALNGKNDLGLLRQFKDTFTVEEWAEILVSLKARLEV